MTNDELKALAEKLEKSPWYDMEDSIEKKSATAILELLDRVKEARNEALEEAARCAASVKGGFSANLDVDGPELVRDEDGPWVINGDIAAAIRALKTEKAPSK